MNEITLNNIFINTKKINKEIKLIFKKKFTTFYSKLKLYLNNECDKEIKQRMQKINNTLKIMINNDVKSKNFKKNVNRECTTSC